MFDISSCFPFQTPREEQLVAINFALDAFLTKSKRFVILELGTGVGKSAIAVTISNYLNKSFGSASSAYVITTQKILQDQYESDFSSKGLVSLKSSTNYTCTHFSEQSCAESSRLLTSLLKQKLVMNEYKEFSENCRSAEKCPYKKNKDKFVNSNLGVTNFAYFLAETLYAGKLLPRQLLCIDEAHNTEAELGKFVELTLSSKFCQSALGIKFPKDLAQDSVITWLSSTYKRAIEKELKKLVKLMSQNLGQRSVLGDLTKKYELLDKHICKINRFLTNYDPKNWILNVVHDRGKTNLEFKTIDVAPFSEDLLFKHGSLVLMLSATIVDKNEFCKSLGIPLDQVAFLSIGSPFNPAHKPIHIMPVGSMSKSVIDTTLPKIAEAVKVLLDHHKNEKGIIHCNTFKIANYIVENVKSSRLLTHTSSTREEIYKYHLNSPDPTVLVSPSMTEGVNLAGDASRFQIICKIPYPYLGDDVVKKRMAARPGWYDYQTAKTIIQSVGRSIRSETDYAATYILDSDWKRFFEKNEKLFSEDFLLSIVTK